MTDKISNNLTVFSVVKMKYLKDRNVKGFIHLWRCLRITLD